MVEIFVQLSARGACQNMGHTKYGCLFCVRSDVCPQCLSNYLTSDPEKAVLGLSKHTNGRTDATKSRALSPCFAKATRSIMIPSPIAVHCKAMQSCFFVSLFRLG